MNKDRTEALIRRLNHCLKVVQNQNSGADIHTVGNIRNRASGLIQCLLDDPAVIDEETAIAVIKRIELDITNFYKNKYQ